MVLSEALCVPFFLGLGSKILAYLSVVVFVKISVKTEKTKLRQTEEELVPA